MTSLALSWGVTEEQALWQKDDCGSHAGEELSERMYNVSRSPRVFGGAAVIAGTRIPVFMIEDMYNEGVSVEMLLDYYPNLSEGQVFAALAYADIFAGLVASDRAAVEAVARAHGA